MAGPTFPRSSRAVSGPSVPCGSNAATIGRRHGVTCRRRLLVLLACCAPTLAGCGAGTDDAGSGGRDTTAPTAGAEGSDADAGALSGYTVDPPPDVSTVVLPTADGSGQVAMPAVAGGIHVVYFGYTSCPDVCPTTMSDLRRALGTLDPDERARVSVSMVTIDPARDQGSGFAGYVARFIPDGSALRTEDPAVLRAAADAFGADYEVATDADGEVQVSHTGDLYAVDDQGRVVLQWPFGTGHESLARDLHSLLADSGHPGSTGT